MKKAKATLLRIHNVALTAVLLLSAAGAAPPASRPATKPAEPVKLRLALAYVADTHPFESIFIINSMNADTGSPIAFKTIESLKKYIASLPAGSVLTWAPSDVHMGQEPLLSSPQDMQQFKDFCKARNVELIIVPGG